MPPQKRTAAKLGPAADMSSEPPWAMVSGDGKQLYYPQSADDARTFAEQHGAVPVNPDLWPWPSEAPVTGAPAPAGQNADNGSLSADAPKATTPAELLPSADASAGPTGGPISAPITLGAELEAAQLPAAPPEALTGEIVSSCPTPAVCWPLGLPEDVSYVTCVHGGWAVGKIGD